MQQHEIRRGDRDEHRQLRRDHASEITLAEKQEPRGKPSVVDGALGDAFGNATEQRKGPERHDQGGQLEPGDQQRVQPAARASGDQRTQRGDRQRQMPRAVRGPEADRREAHHRADRQVDAAGDNDRCQRDRQQAELHAEPRHFEEVPEREEAWRHGGKQHDLRRNHGQQRPASAPTGGSRASADKPEDRNGQLVHA